MVNNMPKIYPVIHYKDDITTLDEALLASEVGADGIFLISHIGHNECLIPLAVKIKQLHGFRVGLNFLGDDVLSTANIVKEHGLDMVWGDYCGVSSSGLNDKGRKLKVWADNNPNIDVFASVAFKYQDIETDPPLAARHALMAGFIPTTSGSGTGYAPSIEKISTMSACTDGILAVASGMNCENVQKFSPYLSSILVATGVSIDEYHFDYEKLYRFIRLSRLKQ